jgi:hypothetical protein
MDRTFRGSARSVLIWTATWFFVLTPLGPASASYSYLPTPAMLAKSNPTIFAGTAARSTAKSSKGAIRTDVTFSDLRFAKGGPADTLTLTLEGGKIGDEEVMVDGLPNFVVGERYIIFANPAAPRASGWNMPITESGCFRVWADSATGESRVFNSFGMVVALTPERVTAVCSDTFLAAIRRGRRMGLDSVAQRDAVRICEDQDPGTRVTEEQFLSIVRGFETAPPTPAPPKTR